MKKPLAICALALLAVALYAQDAPGAPAGAGIAGEGSMLDVKAYAGYFGFQDGKINISNRYVVSTLDDDHNAYGNLGGEYLDTVDTPLEFALLSYYSPSVINIRPEQAAEMLPANDPRAAGLKLGAAVLKELTELRFLDPQNAAAIARYEGMLQFISDKSEAAGAASKVSRAEIDTYYRQGISGLIAGVVDEEFGKISFLLTTNMSKSYNSALIFNPKTKEYTLSYERPSVENDDKELSAPSLEALLAEMRKNRTDFDETGIQSVRQNAALMPAVCLGDQSMDVIKNILTAFYTNPSSTTYGAVRDVYRLYLATWARGGGDVLFNIARVYINTVLNLSRPLAQKIDDDGVSGGITVLTPEQQRELTALRGAQR